MFEQILLFVVSAAPNFLNNFIRLPVLLDICRTISGVGVTLRKVLIFRRDVFQFGSRFTLFNLSQRSANSLECLCLA